MPRTVVVPSRLMPTCHSLPCKRQRVTIRLTENETKKKKVKEPEIASTEEIEREKREEKKEREKEREREIEKMRERVNETKKKSEKRERETKRTSER